jgi:hypothetical protein
VTDAELTTLIQAMTPVVREYVTKALGDLTPRLSALEARLEAVPTLEQAMVGLRDRIVVIETKSDVPLPEPVPPVDLAPMLERIAVGEARLGALSLLEPTVATLRDRVAVVETKAAMPPPALPEFHPPDFTPLLERLSELRDHVMETKAAPPVPPAPVEKPVDLLPVLERLTAIELRLKTLEASPLPAALADLTKEIGGLRERVAVVEVKPPVPGPPGEQGPPGKDGANGKDGTAGLTFQGVFQEGKSYDFGDLVTWGGSSWHCNEATTSKPGDGSKAWTLMVKRGRDGKDGLDAPTVPVVTVGKT